MDLFRAIEEICYVAPHLRPSFKLQLIESFLVGLCRGCRIHGKVVGYRSAERKECRLSRFHDNLHFVGSLRRFNRVSHLMVLVDEDNKRSQLMFSITKSERCRLEIIDVDKASAIRFLLWLGHRLAKSAALDPSFFQVWVDTVIPCCMQDIRCSKKLSIKRDPWKKDVGRALE